MTREEREIERLKGMRVSTLGVVLDWPTVRLILEDRGYTKSGADQMYYKHFFKIGPLAACVCVSGPKSSMSDRPGRYRVALRLSHREAYDFDLEHFQALREATYEAERVSAIIGVA